jgi:sn-glycerol 3-phosphate transport system permease protein
MTRFAKYLTPAYLTIVVLAIAFPIVYAYVGAFRPADALYGGLQGLVPSSFTLDNFTRALNRAPLFLQLGNSLIVTLAQTALQLITGIFAAYALTFGKLRFAKIIFGVFLVSMMIPGETTIIANYLTIRSIGLYDTLIAVFLPFGASAVTIFLLRQSFASFPTEIHEAAVLDGVGPMTFLWRFLLPLSRPTIAAAVITCAIAAWNGYLWPLLITDTPEKRTVQAGISQMADSVGPDIGALLAGSTLVSIPMIILVIIGQSALTRGLTEGASK